MVDLNSIPKGIEAADAMLKAADVQLTAAHSVCAGKYIAVVSGEVAAVRAAIDAGTETAAEKLVDSIVIPNVHPQVITAISSCTDVENMNAVGLMETYSLAAAILASDTAVKAGDVTLIEIRLGRGLGGKAFITMTGEVAAVRASVAAAEGLDEISGLMAKSVVIPSPHKDLLTSIM